MQFDTNTQGVASIIIRSLEAVCDALPAQVRDPIEESSTIIISGPGASAR